jgi:hypothetical protein
LAHVVYLVVELHLAGTGDHDVHLLLRLVPMSGCAGNVRGAPLVAEVAALDPESFAAVAKLQVWIEAEPLREVLGVVAQVQQCVITHRARLMAPGLERRCN